MTGGKELMGMEGRGREKRIRRFEYQNFTLDQGGPHKNISFSLNI